MKLLGYGLGFLSLVCLSLTSCTEVQFQGELAGNYQTQVNSYFPLSWSEINFKQVESFKNEVSLYFNITQIGTNLPSLDQSMIQVSHEGLNIDKFNLTNTSLEKDNIIDIAFVIDVTGTMSNFIEDAKLRIINFIQTSMSRGIRTRMCISTFGNYTVKACDRFYDNDPKNPASLVQTQELISEISNLRAYKGQGKDPGWPDYDENPMQALIDVSRAPFRSEAQKFVIMVTDAGFLYSPQNQGSLGNKAPLLTDVAQAIKSSQISIFGITPFMPGYTSSLNGLPSVIEQSSGEHYLFSSVIKGEVTLNQIMNRILDRVKSTYVLSYVIDDFKSLNPSKPVDFEEINLEIKKTSTQTVLSDLKYQATFPNGSPEFIQDWALSSDKVDSGSARVWVNDNELDSSEFIINYGNLKIKKAPELASHIFVRYQYENVFKNLRLKPLFLNRIVDEENLVIRMNGIPARPGDLLFQRDANNDLSVMVLPEALKDDYYRVKEQEGLALEIQ
jgi:hypothetical protein